MYPAVHSFVILFFLRSNIPGFYFIVVFFSGMHILILTNSKPFGQKHNLMTKMATFFWKFFQLSGANGSGDAIEKKSTWSTIM